jgi:hypothetical protein
MNSYEPKHLHKMTASWMFPYLVAADNAPSIGNARWAYWESCILDTKLPDAPIPHINFQMPHREPIKNIADCIKIGVQQGQRHSEVFELFVTWLLHGFGYREFRQVELAEQLPGMGRFLDKARVLDYWYETFNLCLMLKYPADYMAFFSQGGANKDYNPYTGAGFFATPMSVCAIMTEQLMVGFGFEGTADYRASTVCDPCAGTGSLLLAASNYSMRLYAQDISQMMCNCITVNAYLYMPWMVFRPDFSCLGGPTWEQIEDALFGQPEPAEQPIPVQLPLLTPELEPALASEQNLQPGDVLAPYLKAFQLIADVQEDHNARRLLYADEYAYEWRLNEQKHREEQRVMETIFAVQKAEERLAA